MTEIDMEVALEKAKAFFKRADEVAATDNFDYSIDMYLEGLKRYPDALEDGHAALRKVSLIRQGKGGKKPGMMDKVKRRGGKTPLEAMLNAEYLLARDPDNLDYAEAMLKACLEGGYSRTAKWIADLVFSATVATDKPAMSTLMLLKESYQKLGFLKQAIIAVDLASQQKPEDSSLSDEIKNLSAQLTMERGKYGQGESFRDSIKDREDQEKLQSQEGVVRTQSTRELAVTAARERLAKEPTSKNSIDKLADALMDLGTGDAYTEAAELLQNSYNTTKEFSYKKHLGEVNIRRCKHVIGLLCKKMEKDPQNAEILKKKKHFQAELAKLELNHYRDCVENYPTDLRLKYDYGIRLMRDKQFDVAIPMFQDARRDPRCRITAMGKLGICFFSKNWYADAIDIFKEAIENYEVEDDSVGKELRYNLARAYEQNNSTEDAVDIFRKLAQIDFGYKDVKDRLDKLRS